MKAIEKLKTIKTTFNLVPVLLIIGVLFFSSCNDDDDMEDMGEKNVVEVAASAGQFTILLEAAQKAGLAEYLSNTDGITVFAPTDAAFKSLLTELGATSLNDIPVAQLTNILLYHVIGSKAMSSDLKSGYFPTLSKSAGNSISMYISVEGGVSINKNTKVTTADITAKNGVIHVVDKVILPPSIVNIALDNDNFSILVQAVVKAGLVDALSATGPFTVFAPTNAAFTALFAQLGISGIDNLTAEQLIPILTYHVVSGNVLSTALSNGNVPTLNAEKSLSVNLSSGVKINDSEVVAANIQGSNGVVHVINKVLIP
ncbi:MAG TPA: fasciclin domain-containing protein [Draconibacterium sp.]|nr:fasciclin domain-containing protein [Draconibacterium sp.]